MKNLAILIIILLLKPEFGLSQNRTIQISVSDTVLVEPMEIEYSAVITGDNLMRMAGFKDLNTIELVDLLDILNQQEGIELEQKNSDGIIAKTLDPTLKSIQIKSDSMKFIQAVSKIINKYDNVVGSIRTLKTSRIEQPNLRLKQKLLNKAKKEAQKTLTLINSKAGNIIEIIESELKQGSSSMVDEKKNRNNSGFNALKETFNSNTYDPSKIIFNKQMTITFEILPEKN